MEPLPWLGCQAEEQRGEVGLIGCDAVKARMRSATALAVMCPLQVECQFKVGTRIMSPHLYQNLTLKRTMVRLAY